MGFVQHDQVPRFGILQQFLLTVPAAHQMAGGDDEGFAVPVITRHVTLMAAPHRRRWIPAQDFAVVDRPVQVELLAKLDLPLCHHRLGCQHQDALGLAGQPRIPQQQARLDRLTQTDFVADHQSRWPMVDHAIKRPGLVGPGHHRTGGLRNTGTAVALGRSPDDLPDLSA